MGSAATGYRVGAFTGRHTKDYAEFTIDGKPEIIPKLNELQKLNEPPKTK